MRKIIIFSFFLFSCFLNAQLNPNTKWGRVTQAEIDFKEVSFENEAGAVILFEEGRTSSTGKFETHIYRRIKILNERGLEAANRELVYYSNNGKEGIRALKAQTLNFENGETIKIPVENKNIFDTDLNKYQSSKKFTFPNVKVGSIIEYEYYFFDKNAYWFDAWSFQHEYPTLYSTYMIENSMYLNYTSMAIGEEMAEFSKKNKSKNTNRWTLTNVPSLNTLDYLYNKKDMAERIAFQLNGYTTGGGGYYTTDMGYKDVLTSWKKLNEEIYEKYKWKLSESVGKEVAAAIPNGQNDSETLKNIHSYFKNNFAWDNFVGIYAEKSNRDVVKDKSGSAVELNLLLYSVLKAKGIDADMVLLSTRSNGKIFNTYPYLGQFNMLMILAKLKDNSSYLMDASDLKYDLGFAPLRNYNHLGLIVDPKKEQFITLNQNLSEYHSIQNYTLRDGKYLMTKTDKRNGYFKNGENELPKGFHYGGMIINALDIDTNELRNDFKEDDGDGYEMERRAYESGAVGDRMFISIRNPMKPLLGIFKMKEDKRTRPLEFGLPFYIKSDVVIDIPDGYKVEIPAGFEQYRKYKNDEIVFFQKAEIQNGKLVIQIEYLLSKAVFLGDYAAVKTFFDQSISDAEKVILLKKN